MNQEDMGGQGIFTQKLLKSFLELFEFPRQKFYLGIGKQRREGLQKIPHFFAFNPDGMKLPVRTLPFLFFNQF